MPSLQPGLRAVIDTNVVLSALLFRKGKLSALRECWKSGLCIPVVCHETVSELTRVLGYAKFKLDAASIQSALGLYLPYVEVHELKVMGAGLTKAPHCRDPKDQIFLDLAQSAKVDWLVTGDQDLLVLDGPQLEHNEFRICTPQDILSRVNP